MKGYIYTMFAGADPGHGWTLTDPIFDKVPTLGACVPHIRRAVQEGDYIFAISGRVPGARQFIVGGFNCYPAEIENMLCSLDGVAQAAVIGIPDERLGEVACAFVIRDPAAALDADNVIAWCRDNMANYKVPRAVHIVDSLPTNASGKVLKTELRARVTSA